MPWSDFADMCHDTVTIAPFVSRDGYGKPTYGAPVSYSQVRVVRRPTKTTSPTGQEIMAKGVVWMGDASVTVEDRLEIAAEEQAPILTVECIPDEMGDFYTKVYFG